MKALALLLIGWLCIGTVQSRSLNQVGAAGPAATATAATAPAATQPEPAAGTAKPAATKPAPSWVQRDGYVPLPKVLQEPAPEKQADKPPALPPANSFGTFTSEPPPADPTGTNVFADPKYAPAAVRAAYDAANNPAPDSVLPPSAGVPAAASTTAGMGTGFAGMTLPGQTSSSVFANPPPSAEGGMTPPAAGASDSVFANSGSLWNNKYTPSVGNAIGSSDILVKMIIDAPEQQVATSGDKLRNMFANYTQTPLANVYVYQTRTINGAAGQPSLDLSLLFKNQGDVDRSRQQNVLLSPDVMRVFTADVANRTGLRIEQGSIKTSSAVNDGSVSGTTAAPGPMMPGQLPGFAMPGMAMAGLVTNVTVPGPATAPVPAPAAPANAAGQAAAQLALPLLVLAALAVL